MTIHEAITRIDDRKPNGYSVPDKVRWLNNIDRAVKTEIIDTHAGYEDYADFAGYDADTDVTTELIAPAPYDEMYIYWLEAMIDYADGEYARYNNTAAMYAEAYKAFRNYYNSTHEPLSARMSYFGRGTRI